MALVTYPLVLPYTLQNDAGGGFIQVSDRVRSLLTM